MDARLYDDLCCREVSVYKDMKARGETDFDVAMFISTQLDELTRTCSLYQALMEWAEGNLCAEAFEYHLGYRTSEEKYLAFEQRMQERADREHEEMRRRQASESLAKGE